MLNNQELINQNIYIYEAIAKLSLPPIYWHSKRDIEGVVLNTTHLPGLFLNLYNFLNRLVDTLHP